MEHLCVGICDDDDVKLVEVEERGVAAAQVKEGNGQLVTAANEG
jgi:hypothetical protein